MWLIPVRQNWDLGQPHREVQGLFITHHVHNCFLFVPGGFQPKPCSGRLCESSSILPVKFSVLDQEKRNFAYFALLKLAGTSEPDTEKLKVLLKLMNRGEPRDHDVKEESWNCKLRARSCHNSRNLHWNIKIPYKRNPPFKYKNRKICTFICCPSLFLTYKFKKNKEICFLALPFLPTPYVLISISFTSNTFQR